MLSLFGLDISTAAGKSFGNWAITMLVDLGAIDNSAASALLLADVPK